MDQDRRGGLLSQSLGEKSRLIGSQAETEQGDAGQGHAVGRHSWTPFQGRTSVIENSGSGRSGLNLKKPNFP